jgi:iron complex outermembrane recepter protein
VPNPNLFLAPFLIVAPVAAQAQVTELRIDERRLDRAVEALGRQAGVSIAISDPKLAGIGVRRVRGRMTADAALARMLAEKPLRARRINDRAYIIEQIAPPAIAARPSPPTPIVDPATEPVAEQAIVVTASKRDTLLADYPGAATIVSGGDVALSQAARGTDAIAERAAALTSTHLGPGRNKLFIRGIADSSFTGPTQATVGQYWGNTRVTYSAPDPGLKLYDVASVELLEGPQGTLYGAGALGGIIRIVPQAPVLGAIGSAAWGGVQVTEHGDPGGDAGAVLNLPIATDRLAFRGVIYGGVDGGYIDDRLRGLRDVNRVESWGGRGGLRFAPDAVWTIDLTGTYQSIAGSDAQYADGAKDGLSRESALAQPYANAIALGELSITGDFGATRLVTTLGIVDQHVDERFDATTGTQPRYFDQTSRVRLITSETRLAGHMPGGGWLVGLNLLRNDTRINREVGFRALARPETGVTNRVEEATLYGEATVSPIDALALTAGARLTHSRLSGRAEDAAVTIAFRNDPGARASREETRLLPAIAARYRLSDRFSLFVRYQEGYRPGGLAVRSDFIQRFEPDRVATTEAGLRYRDPGGQVALQVTLATTDWRDIQADIIDGIGFPTTANIGDGRVHSAGASARWSPVPELTFDAALYWNDSKVTTPAPALLSALAGARQTPSDALPNVADLSARAGVDYRADLASGERLHIRGHARYMGQSTLGIGPLLGRPQGDYVDTVIDARLGDARRGISLSLANLFDARGNRFALGSPFQLRDESHVTPLRPRTIRLGFDLSF